MLLTGVLVWPAVAQSSEEDFQTRALRAMKEFIELATGRPGQHSYRFIYIRTFDGPIVVKWDMHPNGSSTITSKMLSGDTYKVGRFIKNRRRTLDPELTKANLRYIDQQRAWELPEEDPADAPDKEGNVRVVLDGAGWTFEMLRDGKRRTLQRCSPECPDPVHDLGIFMLFTLADFRLQYREVY